MITATHDGFHAVTSDQKLSTWLNRTGYILLLMCSGENSEAQVVSAIRSLFDLSFDPAPQIRRALQELAKAGLIEFSFVPDQNPHSLLISVWSPGESVHVETMRNLHTLTQRLLARNVAFELVIDNESSHQLSRNRVLSSMVNSGKHSHVLLLDAKKSATRAAKEINLERLLESGLSCVGIPVRSDEPNWSVAAKSPLQNPTQLEAISHSYNVSFDGLSGPKTKVGSFVQASFVGSAALLISKSGIERMIATNQVQRYRGILHGNRKVTFEHHWGFFNPGDVDGLNSSADMAFCERYKNSGGELMIDTQGEFGESIKAVQEMQRRN